MRAPSRLKFGTHEYMVNTSIKIEVNLINIPGVISNFKDKAKSNFCHAYRVNRFKELTENQYLARLNIRGVPFGG